MGMQPSMQLNSSVAGSPVSVKRTHSEPGSCVSQSTSARFGSHGNVHKPPGS